MIIVILLLVAGFVAGMLLRRRQSLKKTANLLLNISIYLLLFFMGLGIGSNDEIIGGFLKLGETAVILTFFVLAGSILVSWIIYRFFFRDTKSKTGSR